MTQTYITCLALFFIMRAWFSLLYFSTFCFISSTSMPLARLKTASDIRRSHNIRHVFIQQSLCFVWVLYVFPANIKHSNLQLPRDSSVVVPHIQTYKGWFWREGALRNDHTMNHLSYSPISINFVWLWWSPMASEALSYGENFPGEHTPRSPYNTVCYTCKKKIRVLHGRTNPHSMCAPPSSISGSTFDTILHSIWPTWLILLAPPIFSFHTKWTRDLWLSGSSLCFTMHICNADSKLVWTQEIGVNMQR